MTGAVNDDAGRRVANATVVLLPEEGLRYRVEHQTAVTDSTGRFLIPYVPPGNYKVFAWQEIEKALWQDPEFMRRFEGDGKTLRLEESERPTILLNAIKATN